MIPENDPRDTGPGLKAQGEQEEGRRSCGPLHRLPPRHPRRQQAVAHHRSGGGGRRPDRNPGTAPAWRARLGPPLRPTASTEPAA
ncbi:hypothetical protein BIWAKO_06449 [Bosea sp. BIWAKO-01]|nr:hypothetical protein BIWAKO_06449 [Bosea sp. BIWAKO-01]